MQCAACKLASGTLLFELCQLQLGRDAGGAAGSSDDRTCCTALDSATMTTLLGCEFNNISSTAAG